MKNDWISPRISAGFLVGEDANKGRTHSRGTAAMGFSIFIIMKTIFIAICQMVSICLFAQEEDFSWPMGYDGDWSDKEVNNFILNFNNNNLVVDYMDLGIGFDEGHASVSDTNGRLQLYSNGCEVRNGMYLLLENGDSIISLSHKEFCVNLHGYAIRDGSIGLNWPGKSNTFAIFQVGIIYIYQPTLKGWTTQLSYSRVDLNENNGLGKVTEKDVQIIYDSLGGGQLEAVRHANGRDWWLIQNRFKTDKYYIFLFGPDGIKLDHEQFIGPSCDYYQDFMQACFSPDGTKYAKSYNRDEVWLFDFDRCTGMLSNFKNILVTDTDPQSLTPNLGACFSQSGQYLYVTNADHLFQYDTWASDISASKVLIEKYTANPGIPNFFGRMERGPDGKIYMNALNGSDVMHVIHEPDKAGLDCNFDRDGIQLPWAWFYRAMPNQPNWRLGPIDGSSCDTLDIDNIPWAHWRWRADYVDPLKVHFRDLAGFEPTDWLWDFGDGQTSAEKSPIHDYASAGEYTVCCTVSNQYGQDSMCRLVKVTTVLTQEPFFEKDIKAAPNQTSGPFKLYFSEPLERESLFELFDISGKNVFSKAVSKNVIAADFDFSSLGAGLFVWRLSSGGVFLANGKVVKIDR